MAQPSISENSSSVSRHLGHPNHVSGSSAFLEWSYTTYFSMPTASTIFQSLGTLVREDYPFDTALLTKAVNFLDTISPAYEIFEADDLLFGLVPDHEDPLTGFTEAVWSLVASPHHEIVESALDALQSVLSHCSTDNLERMLDCDVVAGVMKIVEPHTISLPLRDVLHTRVMDVLTSVLSFAQNAESLGADGAIAQCRVNDAIFARMVVPSKAYIQHLCSDRLLVLEGNLMDGLLDVFSALIDVSVFHPSTWTFVVSLPIALSVTSASSFNFNFVIGFFECLRWDLYDWRKAGPCTFAKGWTMVRLLNSEGLDDLLDQTLLAVKHDIYRDTPQAYDDCAARFGGNYLATVPKYY
ncbi:hypothetical protein BLNAU_12569 [Blattamonas nauphoetae]|uniref:26S proteasome non-ATPase regulatory subunit 5 n=1 Tax=Blattamonas nauphoetae TaxID=2049346 RepID=A0ABQ9XJ63_9EUKA|nr:hypothetical protein BLNAU_12569 [Blattamonas nauphoetae]